MAARRLPHLRAIPAAARFLSCEPLLGPLPDLDLEGISWVIAGGESGGPPDRRLLAPCDWCRTHRLDPDCGYCAGTRWEPKPHALTWLRALRDRCQAAGIPFFFKQFGGSTPTAGGRLLDGREWNEFPEVA